MSKYISEFKEYGESTLNIDVVLKYWNKKHALTIYNGDKGKEYEFIVSGKGGLKTRISENQAVEIIEKLNLIYVQDSLFVRCGCYYPASYVKSELTRLRDLQKDKLNEIEVLNNVVCCYDKALREAFSSVA